MVVNCRIEFDNNPLSTCYAGQVLTGKVTIEVDHPKSLKGIMLKVNGFAHTSWSESDTNSSSSSTYSGTEDYINTNTYLMGSAESDSLTLETGVHTYTFSCYIPQLCPSSFEGLHGHIRYQIKVVLVRPWKFNQSFTKCFTVLHLLNLNSENALLMSPASATGEKVFCCFPCKSDPLKIKLNVPQSGYVPGQRVPISLLVANESSIPVKGICLELCMMVTYYSQFPSTHTEHQRIVVSKMHLEDIVLRHCNKLFNYHLEIPATPPTCVNLCRLIQIEYQIQAEIKMPGCHPNQVVCMPITVGNVPLMEAAAIVDQPSSSNSGVPRLLMATSVEEGKVDDIKSAEASSASLEESKVSNTYVVPWEANASIPPPSYQESTHTQRVDVRADNEHDYGQKEFAPRYPVFSVASPTPAMTESPQS